ncbi:conserved hypothetical protein [Tenacibaculum sp. 190524A02b]|uniref:Lipoprotein n=1 Tax=Tenacibaculum vairaonense TaxID=3137860 RepID=A0ABP1F7N8_9FLAO
MKKILVLICLGLLTKCKQKPSYNPFDNQFYINESYFKIDKLDTIQDTCGYYSLIKKDQNFSIDYYYYLSELIGKGFSYQIDTIKINKKYSDQKNDSINNLPINIKKLNTSLKKYNYSFYKQENNKIMLINSKNNKIDTAMIYNNTEDYSSFPRILTFVKRK